MERRGVSILRMMVIAGVLLGFTASAALAQPATPDDRLVSWQSTFMDFADQNPGLTPEQHSAVNQALAIDDPRYFADVLGNSERAAMVGVFDGLGAAFSFADYGDIIDLIRDLVDWLSSNDVVAAETPDPCNCSDDDDCTAGSHCAQVACVSGAGSTSTGICSSP